MANYGTYADRTTFKSRLGIASTDTADDAALLQVLEATSKWINGADGCGRHFSVRSETRYFTALHRDRLMVPDLLSITSLKTDQDGDRTYEETWTATDYDLEPFNAFPKRIIRVTPDGDYSFSTMPKGVEIVGLWGYGDGETATPYEDSGTTTNEELDASETAVDVAAGTALAVGQTILVESEQMYITAISTNTLTVRRGVNGTTAATHATAKAVYIYRYPSPVAEATLRRAMQLWRAGDAPFQQGGTGEFGSVDIPIRPDPYVRWLLSAYRLVEVG